MKFYANEKISNLSEELKNILDTYKFKRNFSPENYIKNKINLLNKYMKESKLDTCVVAVSGGLDSALVLALVNEAKSEENSPIKKIVPISLPVNGTKGAVNQDIAEEKAKKICNKFNLELITIDLKDSFSQLRNDVNNSINIEGKEWADGQLVSYLRTPTLYYVTSLLNQEGYRPIVVGTTNKDEGSYLGYFGKASDGMVDVQLISDIHKSEVFLLSEKLGVINEILYSVPTGDMYDNRSDEEVFGAPYDFVELYTLYMEDKSLINIDNLPIDVKNEFNLLKNNLDELHKYNSHKYLGKSPAVHLDVLPYKFEKSWTYYVYK